MIAAGELSNGSTRAANEKPISVSSRLPAAWMPAARTPIASANAIPIVTSFTIAGTTSSESTGMCCPWAAIGVSTIAMPPASSAFTREAIILEEKTGASRNSGPTRPSTRMNATTSRAAICGRTPASIPFMPAGSRADERRDARAQVVRVPDHLRQHPGAADRHHRSRDQDLRDERQRRLLDLRRGLEDRDEQADDEAGDQERRRDLHRDHHRLKREIGCGVLGHVLKEEMSDWITRCQPSTRTKSRILNGSEIRTGGSIIIPMDIRVDEMIMSMIRNGR